MDDMENPDSGKSNNSKENIAWYEAASKGRLPRGIDLIKEYSNGGWEIVMDGEIKEMKPCEIIDELLNRFCKTIPHEPGVGESLETLNDFLTEEVKSYKKR
jgi:hypothetical protein